MERNRVESQYAVVGYQKNIEIHAGLHSIMHSDKKGIQELLSICIEKGVRHAILSPGSRNAPLALSFLSAKEIQCTVIADERSAGFFALGIAQQIKAPIALICTSGTAVLNYAPAIAEAYYQRVPLLVLTADRPGEWTDQGDGQTIQQTNIYANYIKKSFEIDVESEAPEQSWYRSRIISEAIAHTQLPDFGPVHINVPLHEPLYNRSKIAAKRSLKITDVMGVQADLTPEAKAEIHATWKRSKKVMVLVGMMPPDANLKTFLAELAAQDSVTVLTETLSNQVDDQFHPCIDQMIFHLKAEEKKDLLPDLLITIGNAIVSKKVKAWLRESPPKAHWHVDRSAHFTDTFQALTKVLPVDASVFFKSLLAQMPSVKSDYNLRWQERDARCERRHNHFMATAPYSDLKVFELLLKQLPENSQLQLGNSSPVRYAQLFRNENAVVHFANRGTSGVDGTISTAAGAACANPKQTVTVITGDIAFFYDSNALWNSKLPGNLRIVLINNGGGGIFRIIDGPSDQKELESFFEARHDLRAENLAKTFEIPYYCCKNIDQISSMIDAFFADHKGKPALMEIITPTEKNPEVLKDYFEYINQ